MNWKAPAFWAGAGTALGAVALGVLSSSQIQTADKWTGIVGLVASCVLAAAGAFRAGLRHGEGKSVPMTGVTKNDGSPK